MDDLCISLIGREDNYIVGSCKQFIVKVNFILQNNKKNIKDNLEFCFGQLISHDVLRDFTLYKIGKNDPSQETCRKETIK